MVGPGQASGEVEREVEFHTPLRPEDPRRLGPYELLGRLGEGGMGVVYLGKDGLVHVAIKRIREEYADRHRAMRRLRRELDAAQRVPRYCTARIYGYDLLKSTKVAGYSNCI